MYPDDSKGVDAWARTRAWREAHDVGSVLEERHLHFDDVRELYPHYLCGHARDGSVLVFEQLGRLDTSVLRRGRVDVAAIVRHFVFVHEYIGVANEGEETRLTTVLDAGGLGWSDVNSQLFSLIGAASTVTESLVPFRTKKVYVLNAPRWFSAVFRSLKAVLPKNVRDKVVVVASKDRDVVLDAVCGGNVPEDYGGGGPSLGEHADDLAMSAFATSSEAYYDCEDDVGYRDERERAPDAPFLDCEPGLYDFFRVDGGGVWIPRRPKSRDTRKTSSSSKAAASASKPAKRSFFRSPLRRRKPGLAHPEPRDRPRRG